MSELRDFMFERVYLGPAVRAEHARIAGVVRRAVRALRRRIPSFCPQPRGRGRGSDDLAQRVTDYLAGMTDRYCISAYTELQVPQAFAR